MSGTGFKDYFSGHAANYAQHRPGYPAELFAWLADAAPGRQLAWDAGTGNGQAARGLAECFDRVFATDASAQQIESARHHKGVTFAVEAAETCSLKDGRADLVTVSQALHWFDLERFYPEVTRVLANGGLFAAWTYQLAEVSPDIDAVVWRLFEDIVGPWWPPERVHVDRAYLDLPFPFEEIQAPDFPLSTQFSLAAYLDYLRTWSSVQRFQAERGVDPVEMVAGDLANAWGDPGSKRTINWPLALRAGYG